MYVNEKNGCLTNSPPRNIETLLTGVSFSVDLRKETWFFTLLETGVTCQWAMYDPPGWQRTYVYNMEVIGKAVVHGEECLEIRVDEFDGNNGEENHSRHYTQINDQFIKNLAVLSHISKILVITHKSG